MLEKYTNVVFYLSSKMLEKYTNVFLYLSLKTVFVDFVKFFLKSGFRDLMTLITWYQKVYILGT